MNDMLRGRSFSGVAILVRDVFSRNITIHKCAERYVILSIGNVLFVNIYYLPDHHIQAPIMVITELLDELSVILPDTD